LIGKQVRLESQWYTVVAVAPKNFQGMALPVLTHIWVPLVRYAQHNQFAARMVKERQSSGVLMFGRLKPGIAASQAQAELNSVDVQLRREYPGPQVREMALRLERARGTSNPAYGRLVGQLLILLSAVVALVLLIACANVANLLIARGVSRRRQVAIRLAMGAGRARISRQLLFESLVLSLSCAVAGLAAAYGANRILETGSHPRRFR
jgi:predicted lysophospholipase L1 biosynthesis ABC-type transport system permease subunit